MTTAEAGTSSKLHVCLRIKPCNKAEASAAYLVEDDMKLKVTSNTRGPEIFRFSKIFSDKCSQSEIFENTAKGLVDQFLNGKDCLMFAYGTTNAGKTYSVKGTTREPGLVPRAMSHIFDSIGSAIDDNPRICPINFKQAQIRNAQERLQSDSIKANILLSASPITHIPPSTDKFSISFAPALSSTFCEAPGSLGSSPAGQLPQVFKTDSRCSLWISMLEVYNEHVYDLLAPLKQSTKTFVKLTMDGAGNFCPQDNIEVHVTSLEEANAVLKFGDSQRTTMATLLNISSSRSHCILRVRLLRVDRSAAPTPAGCLSPAADVEDFHVSTFFFVDLAGSERVDKAGTLKANSRARETGNINSSLLVLGRCMEMLKLKGQSDLGSSKIPIVPYRESKLTMILQPLLSVSGPKSLLVNIDTSPDLFEETHNVLKFSCVARIVLFKEPPKPLPVLKKLPVNPSVAEASVMIASISDSDGDSSNKSLVTQEQLDEERKLKEELQSKLVSALEENKKLRESLSLLKSEQNVRERDIRHDLQAGFDEMMQEMKASHQKALENKENQLIDLMEKRMDLQEGHYNGLLADAKRKLEDFANQVVPKEDFESLSSNLAMKNEEIERLQEKIQDNSSEISSLKGVIAQLEQAESVHHVTLESNRLAEVNYQTEVLALQSEVKNLLKQIKELSHQKVVTDERLIKSRDNRLKLEEKLRKLQHDCDKYKQLTNFIVNEYHPSARDSLASHNEEELWNFIEKEFQLMPTKCRELEKENTLLKKQLELSIEDFKKLEERRNQHVAKCEEDLRIKNQQLDVERREVQALQKQLMGMTPKKFENITPQREFKTPMVSLSNSVRSLTLSCSSENKMESSSVSKEVRSKSTGRKKKPTLDDVEKENSPLPTENATKSAKRRGVSRRKLCKTFDDDVDEQVDFKIPEANEMQMTRRRLRSTYK
ncbi:kinesin-like protein subito [Neocloeon triangulifer]|uniref:kinesin-like protein subito n=1 Tax=Neocloeon triangulifer TaxID=2078957 RepID=UPI00286F290C|nr:kinesin-like protein subito [Neocloeon triangulifer]